MSDNSQETTRNRLGLSEQVKINDELRLHCARFGDECVYDAGFDDEAIAASMDFQCTTQNVATVREKLFGPVMKSADVSAKMVEDVAELKDKIAELNQQLNDLQSVVKELVDWRESFGVTAIDDTVEEDDVHQNSNFEEDDAVDNSTMNVGEQGGEGTTSA